MDQAKGHAELVDIDRFWEEIQCLQCVNIGEGIGFQWTVPSPWAHSWPCLNLVGHKTKQHECRKTLVGRTQSRQGGKEKKKGGVRVI